MRFYDREIEHIHYPAVQEGRIAVGREELCHMVIRTVLEDQSIEHTVQQVTEGPGEDEAGADNEPAVIFLFDDGLDIIYPEDDGYQSEKGERHLAPGATKLPAPGHALILYKIDLRFV